MNLLGWFVDHISFSGMDPAPTNVPVTISPPIILRRGPEEKRLRSALLVNRRALAAPDPNRTNASPADPDLIWRPPARVRHVAARTRGRRRRRLAFLRQLRALYCCSPPPPACRFRSGAVERKVARRRSTRPSSCAVAATATRPSRSASTSRCSTFRRPTRTRKRPQKRPRIVADDLLFGPGVVSGDGCHVDRRPVRLLWSEMWWLHAPFLWEYLDSEK